MALILPKITRWLTILAILVAGAPAPAARAAIPVTGKGGVAYHTGLAGPEASSRPDRVSIPMAVAVPGLFNYQIIQQPGTNPGFVSTLASTVTQFSLANGGTVGLLAHNYLAGSQFSSLKVGEEVILNFLNERKRYFNVVSVHAYQALSPTDPYSDYIDLDRPDQRMTSTDVFNAVYRQGDAVVFQTCIARNGNSSWGRLFITARPFNPRKVLDRSWILGLNGIARISAMDGD